MKISKGMLVITVSLAVGLSGCASTMIGVREGAERVSQAEANQVAACQSKGKINVSVMAKIGITERDVDEVEANLYQLARNNAVDNGADTLVKGESKVLGTRTFEMFKCRP